MPERALITGITGQDGSYLAEFLLGMGYEVQVHGIVRQSSTDNLERIASLVDQIHLHNGDLHDQAPLLQIIDKVTPDEVYNLAAQSFVPVSWQEPILTAETTGLGVTRVLDAIRTINPAIRFYQAGSSEVFGKVRETPQSETTPFHPRSPYGVRTGLHFEITSSFPIERRGRR